jgi:hypothetical protein
MSEGKLLLHPADQPVFRLLVEARACRCELRINDVPVWSNAGGFASRAMLSVNEWLFAGENEISLRLTSPPGADAAPGTPAVLPESAAAACTLLYKRNRAPWLAMQELLPWSYSHRDDFRNVGIFNPEPPPGTENHPESAEAVPAGGASDTATAPPAAAPSAPAPPVVIHPGELTAMPVTPVPVDWLPGGGGVAGGFTFILPSVWPACPWERALDLTAMQGLDYTASRLVRSLCDSLQRRDWAGLRRLFADRRAALQTAYYLNEAGCDEALAFPELLKPQETKVVMPDPQSVKGVVCGGGKLIRAVAGEQSEPAVSLLCPTLGCRADIETFWLNTGHEWRLAR